MVGEGTMTLKENIRPSQYAFFLPIHSHIRLKPLKVAVFLLYKMYTYRTRDRSTLYTGTAHTAYTHTQQR